MRHPLTPHIDVPPAKQLSQPCNDEPKNNSPTEQQTNHFRVFHLSEPAANHALQRTAPRVTARAFCERSGSYVWGVWRSFHGWARAAPRSAVAELGVVRRFCAYPLNER